MHILIGVIIVIVFVKMLFFNTRIFMITLLVIVLSPFVAFGGLMIYGNAHKYAYECQATKKIGNEVTFNPIEIKDKTGQIHRCTSWR